VSSAARLLSSAELETLARKCRENNQQANVTGLLLHKEGSFMQVLEGEDESVKKILVIIGNDDRHRGLITLLREPMTERQFPQHPLGFVDCSARPLAKAEDIAAKVETFFGAAFVGRPTGAQKLLLNFAKS
jgi:Sensors of blue-light using FAD